MTQPVPPILYKYMSTDRIGFFDSPQLRFSPPAEFNDIFDCQIRTKGFVGPNFWETKAKSETSSLFNTLFEERLKELGLTHEDISKIPQHVREEIKTNLDFFLKNFFDQVVSMSTTEENRERLSQAVQNALQKARVGILCLTPDIVNTSMWGIYATGPKGQGSMGFAVGFDTSNAFFNRKLTPEDALRHLRPVSYPENPPERFLSDYLEDDIPEQSALFELLYIKDKAKWEDEKEWRIAITVPENSTSKAFGIEDVPINAIKEIFLGVFADRDLENTASTFCKQHEIPLYRIKKTVDRVLKPEPVTLNKCP